MMWSKQTSDMPRLLFRRDELVIHADEDQVVRLALESTADAVLGTLEKNGFGWHATVAAYGSIRDGSMAEAMYKGRLWAELTASCKNGPIPEEQVAEKFAAIDRDAGRGSSVDGPDRRPGRARRFDHVNLSQNSLAHMTAREQRGIRFYPWSRLQARGARTDRNRRACWPGCTRPC